MKNEINKYGILMTLITLVIGIILIVDSKVIIDTMSWIIGIIIILISIIKIISLFNDKRLDTSMMAFNILLMVFGVLLISFPSLIDLTIKFVLGFWILFSGVKRLILSIALFNVDRVTYKAFLISSILMLVIGALVLINFYNIIGILLVIYAFLEIADYVFYFKGKSKINKTDDIEIKPVKKNKITKEMKNKKAIEAQIEE